jgi:hypothetical protein
MLAADDLSAALAQEASFREERITHYWDGERELGRLVSQTLRLSTPIAWDNGRVPVPDFWMHQLDERSDLRFDPEKLLIKVRKAIEADLNGETIID